MAYEMARQLHAAGQKVDALVLLDPDSPTHHKLLRTIIGKVFSLLGLGQEKQLDVFLKYIYVRIPSYRQKVDEFKRLQDGDALDEKARSRFLPKIPSAKYLRKQWAGIYRWVVAGYEGGAYPGKIRILWSTEHVAKAIDWSKFSGSTDIESSTFAGTHMSTKEENVPVIIEHLRKCLDEVQA
jgi:thioesterase domain-containing protein